MKVIDLNLANAFRRMKAAKGTDAEMARILGLSRAHVGRILKGVTVYLENETWKRIEPLLMPYYKKDDSTNISPVSVAVKKFPVISEAAAAECNTPIFPIADWADQYAEDHISFSAGREGDFVIRVTGDSMLPWYPPNTLILARPNERVNNGDRVIAVLGSGEVVFKIFAEKGDYFYLFSINEHDGQDFKFEKSDYTAVRAIYVVIQSMRDERALDYAMSSKGIHHSWQDKINNL